MTHTEGTKLCAELQQRTQPYKAIFALQILLGELLAIQILQNKGSANLGSTNTFAHLGNALSLQTGLLYAEVDDHACTSENKQQRSLPREGPGRVPLSQLTHRLGAGAERRRGEFMACSKCAWELLRGPGSLRLRVSAALRSAGVAEGREQAFRRGCLDVSEAASGPAKYSGGHLE